MIRITTPYTPGVEFLGFFLRKKKEKCFELPKMLRKLNGKLFNFQTLERKMNFAHIF
jgi:hypothetical protein